MRARSAVALGLTIAMTAALALPVAAQQPPPPRGPEGRAYLAKLALVLDGTRRMLLWIEQNHGDPALARFLHPLSERYVELAGRMTPTTELRLIHPHLLLVVENAERAVASLGSEDPRAYRAFLRTAREELRTLEAVLHHLHIELREIPR